MNEYGSNVGASMVDATAGVPTMTTITKQVGRKGGESYIAERQGREF